MDDRVWSESFVIDLVDGAHLAWDNGKAYVVEATGLTYWEQRQKAYDSGDPSVMLDAIQLDMAMERMTDMPSKLALLAKLHGWDYADIGANVRDRRRRTGAQLVEDAVKAIVRHERRRAG
jgi:hypothetical protein